MGSPWKSLLDFRKGGALSPLLWLMYFNDVRSGLVQRRAARGEDLQAFLDLIYADDVTTVITAPRLDTLQGRAARNAADVKDAMRKGYRNTQDPKTHNIFLQPDITPGRIYTRLPPRSYRTTRTRIRAQLCRDAAARQPILELDLGAPPPPESLMQQSLLRFPYPLEDSMRVLGVWLDTHFTFDDQFRSLLTRAQARQGILARAASSVWGLETTVLRVT